MYEQYWRLAEKPFQNNLDRRFFYFSPTHSEALVRILYSVTEERGASLVTGDFGSGKSMVFAQAAHELAAQGHEAAFINVPSVPADEFIRSVVYALGGSPQNLKKSDLLHALADYANLAAERNSRIVLFVDDAQTIRDKDTFEELRLLMNVRDEKHELIKVAIGGEPEVIAALNKVPGIRRAVELRYHLVPLDENETKAYISHRLTVAGAKDEILPDGAIAEIVRWSKGVPRSINSVCDLALFIGQAKGASSISPEIVKEAAMSLSSRPVFQLEG